MDSIGVNEVISLQLYKQNLLFTDSQSQPNEDWQAFFKRIGYVQLDSMNVLLRSQDLFFWSRYPHYRMDDLNELYRKQQVLECYLFALCLVPSATAAHLDYHYSLRHRALLDHEHVSSLYRIYEQTHPSISKYSREFQSDSLPATTANQQEKWHVSPVRSALDRLWRAGLIEVSRDANFNKLYRRTARSFYDWQNTAPDDALIVHLVNKSFENIGVVSLKELKHYFNLPRTAIEKVLHRLVEREIVQEIRVDHQSERQFVRTADIPLIHAAACANGERSTLLSPFDNMIRNRERLQRLFGVDYKLESYIPPEKRKYGYYALPILVGRDILGVVDLKNERSTRTLIVKQLTLFSGKTNQSTLAHVHDSISRLQSFVGCEQLVYGNTKEVYV
ncbi:DNA glycosylase AlkZ-like family protein [Paenibacillus campi]|uniref:DNA glycosylase AlkZ-like family protein n=1 Tax=Paenibacillus campi TaxID=3106031 RepID=UPI002AFE7079|nr:crosslink repair DNA glycosylase YcaQ family protein [Paenibacillus sp. SGZ-1014]